MSLAHAKSEKHVQIVDTSFSPYSLFSGSVVQSNLFLKTVRLQSQAHGFKDVFQMWLSHARHSAPALGSRQILICLVIIFIYAFQA